MQSIRVAALVAAVGAAPFMAVAVQGQNAAPASALVTLSQQYTFSPNVTYRVDNNVESKLDVIRHIGQGVTPRPTLIFFHAGGWTAGSKDGGTFSFLPYMEKGFNIFNVGYRLAASDLAPAAVEDAVCALRWVVRNARTYNVDTARIVTAGQSSGGHLAMMAAMAPSNSDFELTCPGDRGIPGVTFAAVNTDPIKVAAVVDYAGVSDVAELLDGPHRMSWVTNWVATGRSLGKVPMAKVVSPLTYVRAGVPPLFHVHGDKDDRVPYHQAVNMKKALDKAGVMNELYTAAGAAHLNYSAEEHQRIYAAIWSFLARARVLDAGGTR